MHKIKNITTLMLSLILVCFGVLIEDRGFAMLIGRDGEPVYPISSGSEDGLMLKVGLYLFALPTIFALISLVKNKSSRVPAWLYWISNVLFMFCLFLVSLDSSLISAARFGDWLPLTAVIAWLSSVVAYIAITLSFSP